jgi:hypothetical protein
LSSPTNKELLEIMKNDISNDIAEYKQYLSMKQNQFEFILELLKKPDKEIDNTIDLIKNIGK